MNSRVVGKNRKRIKNSRFTNKTPFQILSPIQLQTFISPSGLADKKIRVTCRGVNTWMTVLGVAPRSSTASVHQQPHSRRSSQNTLGSEESTPINLSVSVGTHSRRCPAGRVDMWTDIFNNTCPPPGAGHAIWV